MRTVPLVIWVNSPPFVESGPFLYLEQHWCSSVVYAVLGDLRSERVEMGWGTDRGDTEKRTRVRGAKAVDSFCSEILREYPRAVHLIAGLSSTTGRALAVITRVTPPERVAVFSERPGAYGPLKRRLLARVFVPMKYAWLTQRYRRRVGRLLPLGGAGVSCFVRYGWPAEKASRFMYCPQMPTEMPKGIDTPGQVIKFLYVGRLSRYTKGTDILMKAAERLSGEWKLTIVGGHGDLVDEVNHWAASKANVTVLSHATRHDVWKAMRNHDVCVVPSRFDGWNVVVNEALYAGKGVIVTDEAVSDELVEASSAGIVVKAKSPRLLAAAMQKVIDTPDLAASWSSRAAEYRTLIAPENVGRYLMDILMSLPLGPQSPPVPAPWVGVMQTTLMGEQDR